LGCRRPVLTSDKYLLSELRTATARRCASLPFPSCLSSLPEPSLAPALLQDQASSTLGPARPATACASYRTDLADFQAWCEIHALPALPARPTSIALYISALAQTGRKVATIEHRLAALSQDHQLSGHSPSPTSQPKVRITMAGTRRTAEAAQEGKVPSSPQTCAGWCRSPGPPLPRSLTLGAPSTSRPLGSGCSSP
jgi:hypothetical protein